VAYACAPVADDVPFDLTDAQATRRLVRTFLPPDLTGERRPASDRPAGIMHTTQE
jgi:hypothetical protein